MRLIAIVAGLLLTGTAAAQSETPTPTPSPEVTAEPAATPTPEPPKKKAGATVETKGGLAIKSDDGDYEFKFGGRVHLDMVSIDPDDSPAYAEEGGAYFRRARITLTGKAKGWDFKFENDFADNGAATAVDCDDSVSPPDCSGETTGTSSFREAHLSHRVPYVPGGRFTIGQFKPLRGMEELTSSNEVTMLERPFGSASGMFSGRQWAMGGKLEGGGEKYTWGLAIQNNSTHKAADTRTTEEPVITARGTFAPLMSDGMVVHVGLSSGLENGNTRTGARLRGRGKLPATDGGSSRTLAEAGAATFAEDKDAMHAGLELAATFRLFYLQAEYLRSTYTDAYDNSAGDPKDATVSTYYVMASAFVTGESKPYKAGVFKSPKPKNSTLGAIELKARYDFAQNEDAPTSSTNKRELSVMTVGANWYPNQNVRFMLEYSMGNDKTTQNTDGDFVKPTAVTMRTQFHF